jgi:hypothetical protein
VVLQGKQRVREITVLITVLAVAEPTVRHLQAALVQQGLCT